MQRERGEPVGIIGAGLIGLAIASELARRGAAVRVIDAHAASRKRAVGNDRLTIFLAGCVVEWHRREVRWGPGSPAKMQAERLV